MFRHILNTRPTAAICSIAVLFAGCVTPSMSDAPWGERPPRRQSPPARSFYRAVPENQAVPNRTVPNLAPPRPLPRQRSFWGFPVAPPPGRMPLQPVPQQRRFPPAGTPIPQQPVPADTPIQQRPAPAEPDGPLPAVPEDADGFGAQEFEPPTYLSPQPGTGTPGTPSPRFPQLLPFPQQGVTPPAGPDEPQPLPAGPDGEFPVDPGDADELGQEPLGTDVPGSPMPRQEPGQIDNGGVGPVPAPRPDAHQGDATVDPQPMPSGTDGPAPRPDAPSTPGPGPSDASPLELSVTAPPQRKVGSGVTYDVSIRNIDSRPVDNVVIECRFDERLSFPGSDEKTVEQSLGQLKPGETRTIALTLDTGGPGKGCCRFTLRIGDRQVVSKNVCVNLLQAGIDLQLDGPQTRSVGSRAEFMLTLSNTSSQPLDDVKAALSYGNALVPKEASTGARQGQGRLVWDLGSVAAGESVQIQAEFECRVPASAIAVIAEVRAEGKQPQRTQKSLEIVADADSLDVRIHDRSDSLFVGQTTEYVVTVQNRSTQQSRPLRLVARVPEHLRILSFGAQSTHPQLRPRGKIHGEAVVIDAVQGLSARSTLTCRIAVAAVRPGRGDLLASVRQPGGRANIDRREPTTVNP